MEKKRGARRNRSKAYVFMMSMLMVLTSCSTVKDIGMTKIKKIVNDNLEEYYGGTYDIKNIEKKEVGVTAGLKDKVYELSVYSDDIKQEFTVRIRRDGSKMEDNYEQVKYKEELSREVDSLEKNESGWHINSIYKGQTALTGAERSSDYEDYKQSDKVWIMVEAEITGDNADEIARTIYEYSVQLRDHQFRWLIDLKNGKTVETLKDYKHLGNITEEDVKTALERIGVGE